MLLGDGDGGLTVTTSLAVGPYPTGAVFDDLDGDGHQDIVVASRYPNNANVFLGDGTGAFSGPVGYAVGPFAKVLVSSDLNLDGELDLAVCNWGADVNIETTVSILTGHGDGTFDPQVLAQVGGKPHSVAVADFNGDGRPDLAVPNYATHDVSVLLNTTPFTQLDTTPPVTTCSADDAWHQGPVTVTLSATDLESGVAYTRYRVDDGTWQTGESFLVSGEGVHSVEYYSVDNAGNTESTQSAQVKIDNTAPLVTLVAPTDGASYVQGSVATCDWSSSDPLSGVAGEVATIDGLPVGTGTRIDTLPVGPHAFALTVTDVAGNERTLAAAFDVAAAPLTLTITAPNGGESWAQYSTHDLTWSYAPATDTGYFDVWAFSTTKGWFKLNAAPVDAVAAQTDYSLPWTVTQPAAADYKIRVVYYDAGSVRMVSDDSDAVFAITPAALSITIGSPSPGTIWPSGADGSLGFTLSGAVDTGEFDAWLINTATGTSYGAGFSVPVAGQTVYAQSFSTVGIPEGAYTAVVSYRPDAGVWGNWQASGSSPVGAANITDPAAGNELANDLAVVGRYAYIADGVDGLRIVDVSDPQAPSAVGQCDTPGSATDVSVCGSYAYVADGDAGLQVIDVSDPADPAIVTDLQLPSAARRLCFSSGRILADFESTAGFVVSNGTMALDTDHVKHGAASVKMSVAAGKTAILTRDSLSWDLSRERGAMQLWVYVRTTGAPAGSYDRSIALTIALSNANDTVNYFSTGSNYYVQDGWNLLRFTATDWRATGNPSWSQPIRSLRLAFTTPSDRAVEMSFDELRAGERGLMPAFVWTFDDGYDELHQDVLPYLTPLGQKATVYLTASFVGGTTTLSLAHLNDLYAAGWALGNHSTQHVDLSSVDQATAAAQIRGCTDWLISHGFPRAAYHMAYPFNNSSASARAAATECGILTARRHGFRNQQVPVAEALMLNSFGVEDATPTIEAWRAKIDRAIDSGSTLIFYGHYFTGDNLPLFRQIADYVAERRLWAPPIDEWWDTLALQAEAGESFNGGYLYVACGDAGVQVVDISDPTAPVLMGGYATGGAVATDVAPYDDGACVAAGSAGLQVVEALDPATPTLAGDLAGGLAPSKGICVRGTLTYIAAGADGLRIVSTADPAHPAQLGMLDTPGEACDVTVVGTMAYVADGQEGIQVIDVSDPAQPELVSTHLLTAPAEALVVFGNNAYVADGQGGLQVVPLSAGGG